MLMEITTDFDLSLEEENLLDMHSVLNVLNVITYELLKLSDYLDQPALLNDEINGISALAEKLTDRQEALRQIENVEAFVSSLMQALEEEKKHYSAEKQKKIDSAKKKLLMIADVLRVRAREITARADDPHAWVAHSIAQLKSNFLQVFKAIEVNSDGDYHIVGNIARHEEGDYFLSLEIGSVLGETIYMPAVFQDVIRDLIANARKYTSPGGEILAGLYQDESELRFVVADSGRGIPEDEIEEIVSFGIRGSNVQARPTRGGGFGLTKAFYVTKKQNGRMWIERRKPQGTRVVIRLPLPDELPSRSA